MDAQERRKFLAGLGIAASGQLKRNPERVRSYYPAHIVSRYIAIYGGMAGQVPASCSSAS